MDLPLDVRHAVIVGAIAVCAAAMHDYAQQAVAREREHTVMMRMRERGRQYADEVAPDMLTDGRFRRLYRMRKGSFDRLLEALGADPFFSNPGATATPLNVQVRGRGRAVAGVARIFAPRAVPGVPVPPRTGRYKYKIQIQNILVTQVKPATSC